MRSLVGIFAILVALAPNLSFADLCGSYGKTPRADERARNGWKRIPYFANGGWMIVHDNEIDPNLNSTLNGSDEFNQWQRDTGKSLGNFKDLSVMHLDVRHACAIKSPSTEQIIVRMPFGGEVVWRTHDGRNGSKGFQAEVIVYYDGRTNKVQEVKVVQQADSQEIEEETRPNWVDNQLAAAVVVPLLRSQLAADENELGVWLGASGAFSAENQSAEAAGISRP